MTAFWQWIWQLTQMHGVYVASLNGCGDIAGQCVTASPYPPTGGSGASFYGTALQSWCYAMTILEHGLQVWWGPLA